MIFRRWKSPPLQNSGTELRLAKLAGFRIPGREAQQDLLDAARGNAPVIAAFLGAGRWPSPPA
mgnify:CR=1 FL=1